MPTFDDSNTEINAEVIIDSHHSVQEAPVFSTPIHQS